MRDIKEIQKLILTESGYQIEAIINYEYQKRLSQLRNYAANETKELKAPVLRLMQIEEKLAKHLKLLRVEQVIS